MDQTARQHIRLILDDASDRLKRAVNDRLKAQYVSYAADSDLRTIVAALEAIEEETSVHLTAIVDRVSAIAKDPDALVMINENLEISLTYLSKKLDGVFLAAFAFADLDARQVAVRKNALSRFSESRDRLRRQLELHRFTFVVPYKPPLVDPVGDMPSAPPSKPKGGKPLAAHWDKMWAAIAVALHTGDLKPKTQADIERAMKDWLVSNDFNGGDTTVRDKARELWKALEESD